MSRWGLVRLDQLTKLTHMCQVGLARVARYLFQLEGIVTKYGVVWGDL